MTFHLSLLVRAVDESVDFFERVLGGQVTHRDASGYVNVLWAGCQITLQAGEVAVPLGFHFGANLLMAEFDRLAARAAQYAVAPPVLIDAGTPLERKKMYVRCPSGYLIELKGYLA